MYNNSESALQPSNNCSFPVLDYKTTVMTLNSLQSRKNIFDSDQKKPRRYCSDQQMKLNKTEKYLARTGITLEQLDNLSIIHVSGTKGKGSTCAFCESILRHQGFKTGFYSSPHLVAVRERIRIGGKSLSEEQFSKYFWHIYNALNERKESECDMPTYFQFLTVMAFNVFLIEKVDVAIIEVGIGGQFDCTNVLRNVPVVGITSLGMDHVNVLGSTIEEIAWHKSGIFKPGAAAFTVQQSPSVWDVLSKRAAERKCSLRIVPPLEEYGWEEVGVKLTHSNHVQYINASLALQLVNVWLTKVKTVHHADFDGLKSVENNVVLKASAFPITSEIVTGLYKCSWPGRFQVFPKGPVLFFLDGAHTNESIDMCSQWFATEQNNSRECTTVLLFNVGGKRDKLNLLNPLMKCNFDLAVFCPNVVDSSVTASSDLKNFKVTDEEQQNSSKQIQELWDSLQKEFLNSTETKHLNSGPIYAESPDIAHKSYFFPSVFDAVTFIEKEAMMRNNRTNVLVTGSINLVGCVLSTLDPDLSNSSHHFVMEDLLTGATK